MRANPPSHVVVVATDAGGYNDWARSIRSWDCRAARKCRGGGKPSWFRNVRRRQLPSAAARHVLTICGVYLISVVLLLVSGHVAGPSRSSGLIQSVVVVGGLVAIGHFGPVAFRDGSRDLDSLAAPSVDDRAEPSQSEFADGIQDRRTGMQMGLKEANQQLNQLDRALEVGVVVTDDGGRPQVIGDQCPRSAWPGGFDLD